MYELTGGRGLVALVRGQWKPGPLVDLGQWYCA